MRLRQPIPLPLTLALAALTICVMAATKLCGSAAAQEADLAGPEAFANISDPAERSVAIFAEMGKVLTHPRCVNCHPASDRPLQGEDMAPHQPVVMRGPTGFGTPAMRCGTCHGVENVAYATAVGSIPGHEKWHLAPIETAWEDRSLREICEQIQDPERNGGMDHAELIEHNTHDTLVGWGWAPGEGREPAPGSQEVFGALTAAWLETGGHCPQ